MPLNPLLQTAIQAARSAGVLTLKYFKNQPPVKYKADKSPVTQADIDTEKLIREIISKNFPDHGIIGEELGSTNPDAKYQWAIDPIDGTKSFVRTLPDWGILIAALVDGKPIVGVYNSPATGELFYCQENGGTFLNGKRQHVSKIENLKEAFIITSSVNHFAKIKAVDKLVELATIAQGKRGASDCLGLNLLLKGKVDVNISGQGSIWDYAAPAILAEEAGGKFTDFSGKNNLSSGTAIFSNGFIHSQVLKILKK